MYLCSPFGCGLGGPVQVLSDTKFTRAFWRPETVDQQYYSGISSTLDLCHILGDDKSRKDVT